MDVTYYVALPFVMADDGVAPGEAVECTSANAAVMRAEALARYGSAQGVASALLACSHLAIGSSQFPAHRFPLLQPRSDLAGVIDFNRGHDLVENGISDRQLESARCGADRGGIHHLNVSNDLLANIHSNFLD